MSSHHATILQWFNANFARWTTPVYCERTIRAELLEAGVGAFSDLYVDHMNDALKPLLASSSCPTTSQLRAISCKPDWNDPSVYLHYITLPDDSAHLYGGAIWGSNMPKRSSQHYSESVFEASALNDHHTILQQSFCEGGEDFWIKAWSMPDHLFILPKHVVCRVMELGIAVHMGAMNVDKIMLRSLSALSTPWAGRLNWNGLCSHSSLNDQGASSSTSRNPTSVSVNKTNLKDMIAKYAPELAKHGHSQHWTMHLIRVKLMTPEQRKEYDNATIAYQAQYYIERKTNSTPEETETRALATRTSTANYLARIRAMGANPKWWTMSRLKLHGLDKYLEQTPLAASVQTQVNQELDALNKKHGYEEEFRRRKRQSESARSKQAKGLKVKK